MFQTRRVQKHQFIYSFSKIRIFVTKVFRNPFQNPLLEDPAYSAWLSGQKVFESYFKSQKVQFINISLIIAPLHFFSPSPSSNAISIGNKQCFEGRKPPKTDWVWQKPSKNSQRKNLTPWTTFATTELALPYSRFFRHDSNYYTISRSSNSAKTIKHPIQGARELTW